MVSTHLFDYLLLYCLVSCAMILSKAFVRSGTWRLPLLRREFTLLPRNLHPGSCRSSWIGQPAYVESILGSHSHQHRFMSHSVGKLYTSIVDTPLQSTHPRIILTPEETELFDVILRFVGETKLNTTVRVAGGWVRDKVLQLPSKFDIDLALENMTGVQFANKMNDWLKSNNSAVTLLFAVIEQNAEKSKHLETVAGRFGKLEVDIVNLRTESYTQDSRVPQMQIGTPLEDVLRRDLTINSLFYNLHTKQVEDLTGLGLRDLKDGIIRTPLPALITLKDDPLRAFRVVRFACRFGFRIVEEAAQACRNKEVHTSLATKVSRERSNDEMQLMFRAPSAARAVALLHSFGLLQCLLSVPDNLYVPHDTKSERMNPSAESLAVPPAAVAALQSDFVSIGVGTVLAEHYMRQVLLSTVEGAVNNECLAVQYPLCKAMVSALDNTSDLWRLYITSSLLSATEGYMCKAGQSGNGTAKRDKYVPLNSELILSKQLLMSRKDTGVISRSMQSSSTFRTLLQTLSFETPAEPAVPLSRLQLGLAIRQAGENYQYALCLAAAQELVHRLHSRHPSNFKDGLLYERIVNDLITVGAIDTATVEEGHERDAVPTASQLSSPLLNAAVQVKDVYERELAAVLSAMEALLGSIESMGLQTAWAETAPFSGHALIEAFPRAPKGPVFAEMKDCQIAWKLENPSGTDEQLMQHLKAKYTEYM